MSKLVLTTEISDDEEQLAQQQQKIKLDGLEDIELIQLEHSPNSRKAVIEAEKTNFQPVFSANVKENLEGLQLLSDQKTDLESNDKQLTRIRRLLNCQIDLEDSLESKIQQTQQQQQNTFQNDLAINNQMDNPFEQNQLQQFSFTNVNQYNLLAQQLLKTIFSKNVAVMQFLTTKVPAPVSFHFQIQIYSDLLKKCYCVRLMVGNDQFNVVEIQKQFGTLAKSSYVVIVFDNFEKPNQMAIIKSNFSRSTYSLYNYNESCIWATAYHSENTALLVCACLPGQPTKYQHHLDPVEKHGRILLKKSPLKEVEYQKLKAHLHLAQSKKTIALADSQIGPNISPIQAILFAVSHLESYK